MPSAAPVRPNPNVGVSPTSCDDCRLHLVQSEADPKITPLHGLALMAGFVGTLALAWLVFWGAIYGVMRAVVWVWH